MNEQNHNAFISKLYFQELLKVKKVFAPYKHNSFPCGSPTCMQPKLGIRDSFHRYYPCFNSSSSYHNSSNQK